MKKSLDSYDEGFQNEINMLILLHEKTIGKY